MTKEKHYYNILDTSYWLLNFIGIRRDKYGNIPITIRTVAFLIWTMMLLIATSMQCLFGEQTMDELLESVMVISLGLQIFLRHVYLLVRREFAYKLLDDLGHCLIRSHTDKRIVEKNSYRVRKIGWVFVGSLAFGLISTTGSCFLQYQLAGVRTMPFQFWTPYGKDTPIFILISYQFALPIGAMCAIVANTCILFTSICFVNIVLHEIEMNIKRGPENEEAVDMHFQRNVSLHQNVVRIVSSVNDLISPMLFLEVLVSSVPCGCAGYLANFKSAKNMTYFVHFAGNLIFPGIICYCGQLLNDSAESLFNGIYESQWHDRTPKSRTYYQMMLISTTQPLTLQFKYLMDFNLKQYAAVLHGAYSYITLIQNMVK